MAGGDLDEARIVGAHASIWLLQLQRVATESGQPERLSLRVCGEGTVILAEALPGGYGVFLVFGEDGRWPVAQPKLRDLATRLLAEI